MGRQASSKGCGCPWVLPCCPPFPWDLKELFPCYSGIFLPVFQSLQEHIKGKYCQSKQGDFMAVRGPEADQRVERPGHTTGFPANHWDLTHPPRQLSCPIQSTPRFP